MRAVADCTDLVLLSSEERTSNTRIHDTRECGFGSDSEQSSSSSLFTTLQGLHPKDRTRMSDVAGSFKCACPCSADD
jgi:hypothetical protein